MASPAPFGSLGAASGGVDRGFFVTFPLDTFFAWKISKLVTEGPTNVWTEERTDSSYRDAWTHKKDKDKTNKYHGGTKMRPQV